MSRQPRWRIYGLQNPPERRTTTKTKRNEWEAHWSNIREWRTQRKTASDIVGLLAKRGFEVTDHQLNNYIYKRMRSSRRGVDAPFTADSKAPAEYNEAFESASTPSTSSVLDSPKSSCGFDDMEWLSSTGSESDNLSSDAEEFLKINGANTDGSPESTRHGFVNPRHVVNEQLHIDLPVTFQALNIMSYQHSDAAIGAETSHGAFRTIGRSDETLLDSPEASPTPSTRSTVHGHRRREDSENDRSTLFLSDTIRSPSDESSLPSTGFSRVRTRPVHTHGWITVTEQSQWQQAVTVGHILDVLSAQKLRDRQQGNPNNGGKQPIRQVIVVKTSAKMALVVPVRTYVGHGISGLSDAEMDAHAILYAAGTAPISLPEEPYMSKRPLRAKLADQRLSLDPISRINFGKTKILDPRDSIKLVGSIVTSGLPYLVTYWRHHLLTDTKPGDDLDILSSI